MHEYEVQNANEIAQNNYRDYSLYVARGRSYSQITDGLKSSYKRAIYGMWKDAPRSISKVAELAACALPYHPHPTSVSGVIIQLGENGNKLKLMKTQGNWGDSSRGIQASAERYIGGMLSNLGIHLMCDGIEDCDYMTGEIDHQEPVALPTLLPICFINGQSGIPSGLPKLNVPCLDIFDMIDYYCEKLKNKDVNYQPRKLPKYNTDVEILSDKSDWETILKTGKGSIRTAPKMTISPEGIITITALPAGKNIDSVRKVVEAEILADKIDLRDESTKDMCIVIEKVYRKQCDMNALFNKLYKKLQSSESFNMAFFEGEKVYVPCGFDKVVTSNLNYLIKVHSRRIDRLIKENENKKLILTVIEELKKKNKVSKLFTLEYLDAVEFLKREFNIGEEEAKQVLQKPMSYLTKAHHQEIIDLDNTLKGLYSNKNDIWSYLIEKYKNIKKEIKQEMSEREKEM